MNSRNPDNRFTILAVDDQQMNLSILEDYLSPLGYKVIKALSGEEALEELALAKPDIVLLDIIMPQMDGYEVCRRIRVIPDHEDIPIVMITALEGTENLVKALDCGADEFLTKPVNEVELKARVKSLLKKKSLNDQLKGAYRRINDLTAFADNELTKFSSGRFTKNEAQKRLIENLLSRDENDQSKPTHILLGKRLGSGQVEGILYSYKDNTPHEEKIIFYPDLTLKQSLSGTQVVNCNEEGNEGSCKLLQEGQILRSIGNANNFIFLSPPGSDEIVISMNYGKEVTSHEADILHSFLLLSNVFTTISSQVDEIDKSFRYLVTALARAAEANDEETGNHIVRVNEYAGIIAGELGLPENFIKDISFFAQMHDVGKIHIHFDLLRKPGALNRDEVKMIREHTLYGAMILGDEPRLKMARDIALCHHERFDGGGYPRGLRGEEIPLAARIVTMADIYDALRSKRSYKPAFSHEKTFDIITKGDAKTSPEHFDPQVLHIFQKREKDFEKIYIRLADSSEEWR